MSVNIQNSIEKASKVIGHTWPLYSFVTSNPLSGYEKMSFTKATQHAKEDLGARVFPDGSVFSKACSSGEIDPILLENALKDNGFSQSLDYYLDQLKGENSIIKKRESSKLDIIMSKWLSSFMDEGIAEWQMPDKSEGFYSAWRKLAKYDNDLNIKKTSSIPKTSLEALEIVLAEVSKDNYESVFRFHLAALPGWTGYINHRNHYNSPWQEAFPITIQDYLAVRLWIAKNLNYNIVPTKSETSPDDSFSKLQLTFLKAWEKSFQKSLLKEIDVTEANHSEPSTPDAQLVFCIDTRSELIRRHVESQGNYETFGYAGFFGIAMDYENLEDGIQRKSCPPILNSAYKVEEKAQQNKSDVFKKHQRRTKQVKFSEYFRKRMKNMLPSAFGYVEGSGFFYGLSMIARTLIPNTIYSFKKNNVVKHEDFCETEIHTCKSDSKETQGIPIAEQVAIVKSGFDLMGWKNFAELVVFTGHGGHSANNPFNSSLDCGACAASPGRHNARMLAKMANNEQIREILLNEYNISIPKRTVFIGAEHNTTTDEIVLFDAQIPQSHQKALKNLKKDLIRVQETATQERLAVTTSSVKLANIKASSWSETRPEWGLAKNAGFVVGSRALTKNKHLGGRCFLHSYDWEKDSKGTALEGIMQGPMVVTQWINNHYYFSTVDNNKFGGGSKITHNVTGNFGVVQGNGGDLKMGLPLQSLNETDKDMYHQPLRLSVLIHAPLSRVSNIIADNANIKDLLDNEWIYLMVMNPEESNSILQYDNNLNWKYISKEVSNKKEIKETTNKRVLEEVFA
ncbi:DUF2309 domain-containing protein [Winogradskyella sp.]|uniref:DUF2309 domain-containing protein n=1 Tax=Winogradskyella sp. TaxID=1883156 RepID=UPI003F6AC1BE